MDLSLDFATGMWGIWMPGFMQFIIGVKADIGPLGNLGEKALGAFHLATGFWLFYLMFADVLNSVLKFTLYI
jgi:hypothetical protein